MDLNEILMIFKYVYLKWIIAIIEDCKFWSLANFQISLYHFHLSYHTLDILHTVVYHIAIVHFCSLNFS